MKMGVENYSEQPNPAEKKPVYMSVSKFLWGRTQKLHIIIRENRQNDTDIELDSINDVVSIINEKYSAEYDKENIHVSKLIANGYCVIRL
ncbi:hypothetical protein [Brevibacillus reuszeri]|uniref:hypothetical protein n=1 Tax=Brevibacillus reuszeri TaxID=54915 RepID=UPI003D200506